MAATLRGEATGNLPPAGAGFEAERFPARVFDFPDGTPGDIGLFVSWER